LKRRVMKANIRLFGEGLLTSEGDFGCGSAAGATAFHRARIAAYGATMVEYADAPCTNEERRSARHPRRNDADHAANRGKRFSTQICARGAGSWRDAGDLLKLAADFGKSILIPLWVPTPRNLRARMEFAALKKLFIALSRSGARRR